MKKLFFALVALTTLTLASCGNKPVEKEDTTGIEITAEAHDIVVSASFSPKQATTPYFCDLLPKSELQGIAQEAVADSIVGWIKQSLEYYKALYEMFEMEFDMSLEDYASVGKVEFEEGYEANTEYVAVAFYLDLDKEAALDGKIYTKDVTTGALPKSDLQLTLAYNETTQCLDITASNQTEPYYVALFSASMYARYTNNGYTDAELLAEDLESLLEYYPDYSAEDWMFQGNYSYDFADDYGIEESDSFVALAGHYYYGYINSDVAKVQFDYEVEEPAESVKAYMAPTVKRVLREQMPIRVKGLKH